MVRLLILAALVLCGCPKPEPVVDAGAGACLDGPGELTRAPNGQLPSELLPPGFKR